jgi:phage head maturation protease
MQRLVGKALELDPWNEAGLVGTVRITKTPLGHETMTLAEEGILDVSAAFQIASKGESWPRTGLRRITRANLHHIALTPDPAYPGAKVLATRGRSSARGASSRSVFCDACGRSRPMTAKGPMFCGSGCALAAIAI